MEVLTEDKVRDIARETMGLRDSSIAKSDTGQITTFNQLGFSGISDKPDGWYLPYNHADVAVILETKASAITLKPSHSAELLKNIKIAQEKYDKVVGVLYNGNEVKVFKNLTEIEASTKLQPIEYYTSLFNIENIDKEYIYQLTSRINNCLHFEFGIKNLYHRMIFTACALVAKRYDALLVRGMDYSMFTNAIQSSLGKALIRDKKQNQKLNLLLDVFSEIRMNLNVNTEDEKEQQYVKDLIAKFIEWITDISDSLNSDYWRGEDVMGIFFNEFNRYKKKSESGQIFTPEHITDFMYQILEVDQNDNVLDATCGSGGFLVKSMSNMIQEAGGVNTLKAVEIKQNQLFGIEFDREIYALACANMLIHKDGKTNLEHLDARNSEAARWIKSKNISKVLMNPPFESKYGGLKIVENVLNSVPNRTMCAFILPDKKLEKHNNKTLVKRVLSNHRLHKVVKLPEDLFAAGITTSIFIFESGTPQNGKDFFACYMDSDGLSTVKNMGRHDVHGKWETIKNEWVDIIRKQKGHPSCQWVKLDDTERLSYQKPERSFSISDEDFRKTALDFNLFERGIDSNTFEDQLLRQVLYTSSIDLNGSMISVTIEKDSQDA